jgi:hypothetical protein
MRRKKMSRVNGLHFGEFIQWKGNSYHYEWIVNGTGLMFYSEKELISQQRFRELCVKYLHTLPKELDEEAWGDIVNDALSNVLVRTMLEKIQ